MKGLIVVVLSMLAGYVLGHLNAPKQYGPARTYKLYNGAQSIGSFKGQEIRSNGLCIEVWLNGRVDTLACAGAMITETVETTGVPDSQVHPVIQ